jgi:hypothetical protein
MGVQKILIVEDDVFDMEAAVSVVKRTGWEIIQETDVASAQCDG